jgi:hypothetical protein
MSSDTRLTPRALFAAQRKCDDGLRLLASSGATPRQMLWGLWWCHTLPTVCKSLAAVGCAGLLARLVAGLLA